MRERQLQQLAAARLRGETAAEVRRVTAHLTAAPLGVGVEPEEEGAGERAGGGRRDEKSEKIT